MNLQSTKLNSNSATNLVLTVGNSMMGDDGAGPLLAERMAQQPLVDWQVIDGGSAPENVVHRIRALQPTRLIIVDAADMELPPGEIRIIDPERIAEMFIMSTHNLPLNFLIDQLKEDIREVIFVGIQPTLVAFYFPMTDIVKQAVETLYQQLPLWQGDGGFSHL
ncbi:hydrogenase 3 maturation protease [Yersinia rohdei]|uniref:Hydrogenase 3 maturation protease n=2 Tax=Yersinia rohdei TaxID=29485 RepID=A0A0U1HTP2_YERRO|nr:hydrogenase maturation peptidase HycI [Yersinia rohdei]MDN0096475.1 hydrogenase maturation peptidase HycI [Yersinia rohdei]OWF81688.1 hydrogenase 3 maturation endopeptidase HyCI [Yersinia rohdei]CNE76627.1 hydrogenase 3 maturation protease [Yersinia rohdei]CNI91801.1 hydrogenase 3 maturation protease [Yersinia rohdei]CQI90705.1 hydrogenase 3 maturation protease [Yersinia rohdei]